eukprot:1061877-Prorocentrum_lima.AAC.1
MTSSLVGSEMCIRDRQSRMHPSMLQIRKGPRPKDQYTLADPVPPGKFAAVSYTHLTLPTICSV